MSGDCPGGIIWELRTRNKPWVILQRWMVRFAVSQPSPNHN